MSFALKTGTGRDGEFQAAHTRLRTPVVLQLVKTGGVCGYRMGPLHRNEPEWCAKIQWSTELNGSWGYAVRTHAKSSGYLFRCPSIHQGHGKPRSLKEWEGIKATGRLIPCLCIRTHLSERKIYHPLVFRRWRNDSYGVPSLLCGYSDLYSILGVYRYRESHAHRTAPHKPIQK